jgi:hypothetical protein
LAKPFAALDPKQTFVGQNDWTSVQSSLPLIFGRIP